MMLFGTHWPHVSMCPVHVSTKWSVSLLFWAVKKQPRKRGQFKIRRTKVESYTLLGTITYPSQSYFWVDDFPFFPFGGIWTRGLGGFRHMVSTGFQKSSNMHPLKPPCLCWNDLFEVQNTLETWHKPGCTSWGRLVAVVEIPFFYEAFSTIQTVVGNGISEPSTVSNLILFMFNGLVGRKVWILWNDLTQEKYKNKNSTNSKKIPTDP